MFNFYIYDRFEKGQEDRKLSTSQDEKRKARYNIKRDELAGNYKERVVNFLQEMTDEPIRQQDYYNQDEDSSLKNLLKFKGKDYLRYTNNQTDAQRVNASVENNSIIDTSPIGKPEHKAWNLRPRIKQKEIGPNIRFQPKIQIERIYDNVTQRKSSIFKDIHLTHRKVHSQVRNYIKTGNIQRQMQSTGAHTTTGIYQSNMQQTAFSRESKLGNNLFLKPHLIMNQLHKKSHFKAATSLLVAQNGSLELKSNDLKDLFLNIAKNIHQKNLSFEESTYKREYHKRSIVSQQNLRSQTVQPQMVQSREQMNLITRKLSVENEIHLKKKLDGGNVRDLSTFNYDKVNSKQISENILKLCNVVRERHYHAIPLKKNTGKGGGPGGSLSNEQSTGQSYGMTAQSFRKPKGQNLKVFSDYPQNTLTYNPSREQDFND